MSRESFDTVKRAALRQTAAAVVCRETGLGFYYPYLRLKWDGDMWRIHGNTMAQFGDELPPLMVDWAMASAEALMPVKDEDFDPTLTEDITEAVRALALVKEFQREIIQRADAIVTQLLLTNHIQLH